jgi:biotin carboxylase/D-alanine-D-alanine ligase-like ATP-grasp enzyme
MEKKGSGQTILWINSGGPKKAFTLEVARRAGYRVVLVNSTRDVPERLYEHFIQADTYIPTEVVDRINIFQEEHPEVTFDGAITFWEDDIPLLAKICEHLGLIGNSPDTAFKTRNKYEMRKCFQATGLSSTDFQLIRSVDEVIEAIRVIGLPAVMKPVCGADSEFVLLVKTEAEAIAAWSYLSRNCTEAFNPIFKFNAGSFLFEKFIDGLELSVECFSQYGIPHVVGINEKQPITPPYFVEAGDICPARLDDRIIDQVRKLAESSLIALGVESSLSHVELKINSRGPALIEVASRMGGDDIYQNIRTVYGHDLVRIALQIATGEHVSLEHREPKGCVVSKYFIPAASGIITNVGGVKGVKNSSSIIDLVISKDVGDAVLTPPVGFDNIGWVSAKGSSYQEAEAALDQALRTIEINVTPFNKKSSLGVSIIRDSLTSAAKVRQDILRSARMRKIREKGNQTRLRVGLLIDASQLSEVAGLQAEIEATEKQLRRLGHEVIRIDTSGGAAFIPYMQVLNPDFAIILVRDEMGGGHTPYLIGGVLDFIGIPYLGAGAAALSRTKDLILVKKLLEYHEVPTPTWDYVSAEDEFVREDLQFPVIVRSTGSVYDHFREFSEVVGDSQELTTAANRLIKVGGKPVLIEELIDGDVYEVYLFGNTDDLTVLPPLKVSPSEGKKGTQSGSDSHSTKKSTRRQTVPGKLLQILTELSIDIYRMFSCRDFGRITCIVDNTGNPYVLNVTADLDLAPGSSIFKSGALDGYSYSELFEEIISASIRRLRSTDAEVNGDSLSQSLNKTTSLATPGEAETLSGQSEPFPTAADVSITDI